MRAPREGRRVLAVDFGDRRTGVAASAGAGGLVFPVAILDSRDRRRLLAEIGAIAAEREAELVLVGLPLAPDGGLGARGAKTLAFARELARALDPIPVFGIDERHSTTEAHERLKRSGMKAAARKRKGVDAVAAQVLLEAWMRGEREIPLERFFGDRTSRGE